MSILMNRFMSILMNRVEFLKAKIGGLDFFFFFFSFFWGGLFLISLEICYGV